MQDIAEQTAYRTCHIFQPIAATDHKNKFMYYCFTFNSLKMPSLLSAANHTSDNKVCTLPGVECPLATACSCIPSSLVASCTRTSASRHKGVISALSQVSPSTTAHGQAVMASHNDYQLTKPMQPKCLVYH